MTPYYLGATACIIVMIISKCLGRNKRTRRHRQRKRVNSSILYCEKST